MAWHARLLALEKINGVGIAVVQYYEDGGDLYVERYRRGVHFSTKPQLQAYVAGVVDGLNAELSSYNQMQTALSSNLGQDL